MKATRLLPLLGVLAIALIVVAFIVTGDTPDPDDPVQKIASFYRDNDSEISAGGLLLMAAAAALLAWSVQVRSFLMTREGGPATRATLGLVGTVVFAVGMAVFAGIFLALGDVPDKLDPSSIQLLNVLNEDLFPPVAIGAVLALFGYGLAVLRTRALPAWLGWVAVLGAILTFTPIWFAPFIAFAIFVLVSSVVLAAQPVAEGAPAVSE